LTHATGQRATRASALLGLAGLSYYEDKLDEAEDLAERALTLVTELGWTFGMAQALRMLGEMRSRRGDRAGARQAYEESLRYSRVVRDELIASGTLNMLGSLAIAEGDYRAGYEYLAEGLALCRELDDSDAIAWSLLAFARLRAAEGRLDVALCLASAETAIHDQLGAQLPPRDRLAVEQWLAPARQALDQRAAENACAIGRTLSVQDAVRLALSPDEYGSLSRRGLTGIR
jgi:tetratricopeptide (TPR) repeat protein